LFGCNGPSGLREDDDDDDIPALSITRLQNDLLSDELDLPNYPKL